eukprot:scaffold31794_cov107-Isochrysis_galbana.AAC.13
MSPKRTQRALLPTRTAQRRANLPNSNLRGVTVGARPGAGDHRGPATGSNQPGPPLPPSGERAQGPATPPQPRIPDVIGHAPGETVKEGGKRKRDGNASLPGDSRVSRRIRLLALLILKKN